MTRQLDKVRAVSVAHGVEINYIEAALVVSLYIIIQVVICFGKDFLFYSYS